MKKKKKIINRRRKIYKYSILKNDKFNEGKASYM